MSIGGMVFPSIESSSMDDQVKHEFNETNGLSQVPCINSYARASLVAYKPNQIISSEADSYIIDNVENDQDKAEVEDDDDAYFSSLPSGYRFKPLDEELIEDYLRKKIDNKPLPRNQIREVELYKYNPEDLAVKNKANGEDEWYFFTPRDRKYPKGDRPNRAAGKGEGYWKATGADKAIKFKGKKVGLKKSLVFYRGKAPHGDKTDWIMHEYKVADLPKRKRTSEDDMKLDDWVLCKIRKKRSKSERSAKAEPSFQDQPTGGDILEQEHDSAEFAMNIFNNNYEMEVPFIHDYVSFANAQQTFPMMGHNSFAAGNYGQISEPSTDTDPGMDQIYLP